MAHASAEWHPVHGGWGEDRRCSMTYVALSSYSSLKRGINHSREIPNGGMQDAFLSERTLCIRVD